MDIREGDYVTRISHKHDMVFKVISITDDICYLKGANVRLYADSNIDDLVKIDYKESDDNEEVERLKDSTTLDRDDYFYLPGKILHIYGAFYDKKGSKDNINNYKNSKNFVSAIKEARKFEKSHDKLIIIAGACQSDYEELIRAGANFASSPKRINIHALDPAIIASRMSLSDINKDIDLKNIIESTKYGKEGIGGIITKGTMYMGYPR